MSTAVTLVPLQQLHSLTDILRPDVNVVSVPRRLGPSLEAELTELRAAHAAEATKAEDAHLIELAVRRAPSRPDLPPRFGSAVST